MRVLVAAASQHGSTGEIARSIARTLEASGLDVDRVAPESVSTLDGYDAVVLGSAVYSGRWMDEARSFINRFERDLRDLPVFLFSSGPLGEPPRPETDPDDATDAELASGAVDHRVFAGRLVEADLSMAQRLIVTMAGTPYGDYRPWDDIEEWAAEIARFLKDEDVAIALLQSEG